MQTVITLRVASTAHAQQDTLAMDQRVWVSVRRDHAGQRSPPPPPHSPPPWAGVDGGGIHWVYVYVPLDEVGF